LPFIGPPDATSLLKSPFEYIFLTKLLHFLFLGAMTVVAGSLSIHCSRGFGGYESSGCSCTKLRWLGPNPRTAALLAALWGTAFLLIGALGVRSCLTLVQQAAPPAVGANPHGAAADLQVLALVQLSLALLITGGGVVAIKIDCSRDPD
jgi:hypothetical protein